MHFDKSEIYVTAGGSEALQIALQCILDDGDEILIPEPFYPNYNTMVRTCGASIRPIPTCPEEGYHYADREKIEPLINEHTRAIMVTNPGNPTGVVLSQDEMEMLVDLAQKHDLFLIGDEAYREFVYKSASVSHRGGFAYWSYGTRKSSGYFLNLLPGVVVVHVMNLLFPYTANIYAHVMENADRKNADILADVFLKKA